MQSISEIKEILGNCSMEELPEQMKQFEDDSRKGVQTALANKAYAIQFSDCANHHTIL